MACPLTVRSGQAAAPNSSVERPLSAASSGTTWLAVVRGGTVDSTITRSPGESPAAMLFTAAVSIDRSGVRSSVSSVGTIRTWTAAPEAAASASVVARNAPFATMSVTSSESPGSRLM